MENEITKKNSEILEAVRQAGLYPEINVIEGGIPSEPEFAVNGRKVLSFCSANYLGLANDDRVKRAISEGLHEYGIHPSASPMISGTLQIHRRLERQIADFLGKEDTMIFNTSTMANMGIIPALVNAEYAPTLSRYSRVSLRRTDGAVLFADALNHATINEGCRLAKATKVSYKHCDMNNLEQKLRKFAEYKRKLILSDGVFSTNGRIAPLSDIVQLAKKYDAMIYIDDATATGFMGEDGGGTAKHFGVQEDVDIIVTNLAKSIGVVGGIAAASREMIDYLRITAKTYVFSGALIGALANGALKALEIVKTDGARRTKLWENTRYLKDRLQRVGFDTLGSETPIIPILIGAEETAAKISKDLFDRGILCPPFRYPAAPRRQALLRFNVTCQHSKQQLDKLVDNLAIVGEKYGIIY